MSYDTTKSFIQHEDREAVKDASFLKQMPADCMRRMRAMEGDELRQELVSLIEHYFSAGPKYIGTTHGLSLLSKGPGKSYLINLSDDNCATMVLMNDLISS